MLVAIVCSVDSGRESDRLKLRADHLAYIWAHRERIVTGGPTLSAIGAPETMILIVEAVDLADAARFIRAEPYASHGVFKQVEIRRWIRVLPEAQPGAIEEAIAQERSRRLDNSI